jgi:hypothetical protein
MSNNSNILIKEVSLGPIVNRNISKWIIKITFWLEYLESEELLEILGEVEIIMRGHLNADYPI